MTVASTPHPSSPGYVKFLLYDRRAAVAWLPLRLWLGWHWVQTADHKLTDPAWMQNGAALREFWEQITATSQPSLVYGWYQNVIQVLLNAQAYTWLAKWIVYTELLLGIALLLGVLTGFSASAGAFMNWNALMAGATGVSLVLLLAAFPLIAAWRVAGNIGVDYFLLTADKTPAKARSEAL